MKKLVVTPLDPHSTVKFVVRFSFSFDVDFDLREATLSPALHQSLSLKVIRESRSAKFWHQLRKKR